MAEYTIDKIEYGGNVYKLQDNISGYTTNTGTITKVKTTAGAHTTIDVSSGAATFNVPTKTSHLTNDSGFIKTNEYFNLDLPIVYEYTYTAQLILGNSNSNSTSSGSSGSIKLYGDSSYYGILVPKLSNGTISLTANRSWGLPDKSGRIALIEEVSSLVTAGVGLSSSLFEYGDDIEGIKHVRLKANLNSETSLGTIGTTNKLYAVGVDSNGQLCVNVPWTNVNSSYLTSNSSLNAANLTGTVPSGCYTNTNTTYSLSGALSSHKFTSTLTAGGSGSGTSTSDFTLAAGTGITITDDTSARKMTIACSVTNTDEKVKVTALTSGTTYYPILATGTGTATRQIDSTLAGLTYRSTAGTTSSIGTATLMLGNSIPSGTANNERGRLILYSPTNYYVQLQTESLGANRTITLPNKAGILAITSDITDEKLEVNALTSGTTYYPILATGTGTATRQIDSTLNGLTYKSTAGTTSTVGSALLTLGNDIAEGTTNNEEGQLALYGPSGKYAMIVCDPTANRILELPDQTGVLATTEDIYESVELTQLEYDALSSTDKNDPKKVYFVKDADPSETSELLDIMYPIGSYYETADINFDPNLTWGGIWVSETITDNKIVEEGKTNDWTYRKWSSGIAECWKQMTLASGAFTATGNIYYRSASGYSLPSGLFNAAPVIEVNAQMGNVGAASALNITSSSFAIYTMSAVSTAREISFGVYASGTWKTYGAPSPIYKWTRLN